MIMTLLDWIEGCSDSRTPGENSRPTPLKHLPDLFHLLRPLARCGERFYRQALAALAWEYARGALESGRAEAVSHKRLQSYEAAKAAAAEKIQRYDNFCYLWTGLRKALELCNEQGEISELVARQAEIGAILELMRELGGQQLQRELSSFAAGLEGYWDYYRKAEAVYQGLMERYPRAVVQALADGWQAERQATNSKDYGLRQRLAQEAAFYYDYAASLVPAASETIRKEVVEALDSVVRSSSLVENVNAALRPLVETCRGQGDQEICT
jgi:hypothetical protein